MTADLADAGTICARGPGRARRRRPAAVRGGHRGPSGQPATAATWRAAGELAAAQIDPPADGHGSAAYRKKLAATLVERALSGSHPPPMTWVGAPVARTQDRRMLLGRGQFTGDLARTGTLHAAFVRSPFAAARFGRSIPRPRWPGPGVAAAFTAADLGDPYLLAVLERHEFVPTRCRCWPSARSGIVGEPVAVVLADDPYLAEDAAELVDVDWSQQPVVASLDAAHRRRRARQVHDGRPATAWWT